MKFLWIFDVDGVWLLVPLVSFLWAAGGSGPKLIRKLGVPLLIGVSALSLHCLWWLSGLTVLSLLLAISIPYGSSLQKALEKKNLLWAYYPLVGIVASLYAAAMLPLVFFHQHWLDYIFGILISGSLFGILTFSSQVIDFPEWKWVEIVLGACLGLTAALLLR